MKKIVKTVVNLIAIERTTDVVLNQITVPRIANAHKGVLNTMIVIEGARGMAAKPV
jgi:hypothetical protein